MSESADSVRASRIRVFANYAIDQPDSASVLCLMSKCIAVCHGPSGTGLARCALDVAADLLRAAGHHVAEATPHYGTIVGLESAG